MPRECTKNAGALAARLVDERLREAFEKAFEQMPAIDKTFLKDVLVSYNSNFIPEKDEIGIAAAFELELNGRCAVVVEVDEWNRMLAELPAGVPA